MFIFSSNDPRITNSVFGVLTLYSAKSAAFSTDHLRTLEAIQSRFSLSLEKALRARPAEPEAAEESSEQLAGAAHAFQPAIGESDKTGAVSQAQSAFKGLHT